jgi:AAA ATPase domain
MEGGLVHGILGRDAELAEVQSFVGSGSGGPTALLLEGTAGIGKTTLWRAGVSFARARGHRVLSCRAAEAEARLSYAALGDLFDFELPDLPAPQRRALDAALLREEVEGAPPDQRAVSLASLGVLRALAASAPVIIAIDDVQWLDAPSARVLAFVVRRLGDAPIRTLVALRVGSGGDPLALGRAGPAPSLHRVSIGPLREEAMTRLLRARTGGISRVPSCCGSTGSRKETRSSPSRSPGRSPGRGSGRRLANPCPSPRTCRRCSAYGSPRYCRAPLMGSSSWRRRPGRQNRWWLRRQDRAGHRPASRGPRRRASCSGPVAGSGSPTPS